MNCLFKQEGQLLLVDLMSVDTGRGLGGLRRELDGTRLVGSESWLGHLRVLTVEIMVLRLHGNNRGGGHLRGGNLTRVSRCEGARMDSRLLAQTHLLLRLHLLSILANRARLLMMAVQRPLQRRGGAAALGRRNHVGQADWQVGLGQHPLHLCARGLRRIDVEVGE